jgi:hypothetical protein
MNSSSSMILMLCKSVESFSEEGRRIGLPQHKFFTTLEVIKSGSVRIATCCMSTTMGSSTVITLICVGIADK